MLDRPEKLIKAQELLVIQKILKNLAKIPLTIIFSQRYRLHKTFSVEAHIGRHIEEEQDKIPHGTYSGQRMECQEHSLQL